MMHNVPGWSLAIIGILMLLSSCVTENGAGNGVVEYLCEGFCTHRTATGSIQRVVLTFHSQDQQRAWKGLHDLCLEIQSIGASQNNKKATEPLIASETTVVDGSKEYGFRLATKEQDCEKRLVSVVVNQ